MMIGHICFVVLVTLAVGKKSGNTSESWTEPAQSKDRAKAACNHEGYHLMKGRFGKETHWLCLKNVNIGKSSLASESAAILLDPDAQETGSIVQAFPLDDVIMAHGYPTHSPHAGSAEGYIGDDNHFYGVLHLGNRTLHADPYGKDDLSRKFGAYDYDYEEDVGIPRPRRHNYPTQYDDPFGDQFSFRIEERKRSPGTARSRVCDLLLLADREFYVHDANSSLNHVIRRMVHAVAQADIIFRNTDFNEDGIPDNIGFSVKYILILTSNETNQRVFGNLLDNKVVDGRQYLMKFARLRRLSEVCLGVAFSGHAFHNRTLGLSFTSLGGGMGGSAGGLCDRRAYGRSFNTLALAHATQEDNDRVPERIAALTLSHEMGHSFGAHHDDNFPNPECRGFLMGSQSTTAENSRHFEFSICSKRLIAATLNSMSYCLTEEDRPYCGNGIVEEGEACDCGMPTSCNHRDPCCTPRAGGALVYEEGTLHVDGCSVAPKALCHPSQGMCCTQDCKFANLTGSGIDCTSLDQQCNCVDMDDCRCTLSGKCTADGTCHAAECVNLGLSECQCHTKATSGAVKDASKCGICCLMQGKEDGDEICVGVERAARIVAAGGVMLPTEWPDAEYEGPNVTVNFCTAQECRQVALRAWSAGDTCVSRGVVGMCSFTGVCKPRFHIPRSNVYPTVMSMQLAANLTKKAPLSSRSTRLSTKLFLVFLSYTFLLFDR